MGIAKKINWDSVFIFLFLIIFPFGQIIRLNYNLLELNIPLLPIDAIVGVAALYNIFFQKSKSPIFIYIKKFLAVALFSYLFSLFIFGKASLYGLFYLLRITAYAFFLNYVWQYVKKSKDGQKLIIDSLLSLSVVSAVFGWIQYFSIPDLKPLYYIGWDMHLFRLAGTFLDPTFLGLIIVFGLIISIEKLFKSNKKYNLVIALFLLISLAFTYARAAYLAFFAAITVIGLARRKFRKILYWIFGLALIALLLPTAKNHSIELTRIFSVSARIHNYKEALTIIKQNPVLGIGFNNMCIARNKYIGTESFDSHACSGSDSSILLIWTTTGLVGLIIFLDMVVKIIKRVSKQENWHVLAAVASALFVHSLFSNSLFYPWIMGYLGLMMSVYIKERN